jgi:signal transduction histidine kinase
MWTLITLLWRILTRLMRRLGWGGLLVPVAALGVAVFGVTLWTVAAVALAVILVVRRPGTAAGLLPVTLVCAGIWGLALAAATPGVVTWSAMPFGGPPVIAFTITPDGHGTVVKYGAVPVQVKARKIAAVRWRPLPPPTGAEHKLPPPSRVVDGRRTAWQAIGPDGLVTNGPGGLVTYLYQPRHLATAKTVTFGPPGSWTKIGSPPGVRSEVIGRPGPPAGLVRSWLLVPLALLMLTVGLWLMPRSLARLRQRAGPLAPYLRHRLRETGWGLALVPVTVISLSVFGVRPWTVAAVIAALVITIRWPKVAADLVPFVLIALALRGFQLAARWGSLSPGLTEPGVPYGFVTVAGRQGALAAGAEASAFLAFGAWLAPRTIGAHLRTLFGRAPDTDLAGRVQRLTETRGHAVDAAAAELRRIERDLHDGAQARLVALGMNLRAVERVLPGSPNAALALVAEARETSVRALNELRNLIRGICPPVLADRGLGHAVQALVLDTPLPTTLEIDLPGRPTPPVESACYFAIAEALANAVKHAGARSAQIRIRHSAGLLRIEVSDDGIGGADPALGTGLLGVERRLGTFDGILAVNSPPGGPTMVVMEVPCALSSPKTCSS